MQRNIINNNSKFSFTDSDKLLQRSRKIRVKTYLRLADVFQMQQISEKLVNTRKKLRDLHTQITQSKLININYKDYSKTILSQWRKVMIENIHLLISIADRYFRESSNFSFTSPQQESYTHSAFRYIFFAENFLLSDAQYISNSVQKLENRIYQLFLNYRPIFEKYNANSYVFLIKEAENCQYDFLVNENHFTESNNQELLLRATLIRKQLTQLDVRNILIKQSIEKVTEIINVIEDRLKSQKTVEKVDQEIKKTENKIPLKRSKSMDSFFITTHENKLFKPFKTKDWEKNKETVLLKCKKI